jgi:hypothetical protein
MIRNIRHARTCCGHPRMTTVATIKDVDGRIKSGHDEAEKSAMTRKEAEDYALIHRGIATA